MTVKAAAYHQGVLTALARAAGAPAAPAPTMAGPHAAAEMRQDSVGLYRRRNFSATITASVIRKTAASTDWFTIHVSSAFATDILITLASTYFLLKARQRALARIRQLIRDSIKLCFQTALPVTTATHIELVCSRGGKSLKPRPTNSVIIVLLAALPVIYANCLLYVLNTRRALSGADSSDGFNNDSTICPPSGARKAGAWNPRDTVELSGLGDTQVHTQVETSDANYALKFDTKKSREITA
ncbi:hypothetical protein C8J57DRAFT_1537224 [Mycena rebaudengoi]|nr:hypothetical protein C8J57DRAFT_1537224 [Mycena rebaudengoi]